MRIKNFSRVIEINKDLEALREEINFIDNTILSLLERRAAAVHSVGELKKGSPVPIYVPERERAIFSRLISQSSLPAEMIVSVYREIISACRSLEGVLTVAILQDFHSEVALRQILGTHVKSIAFKDVKELKDNLYNFSYILLPKDEKLLAMLSLKDFSVINETSFKDHSFLFIKV